MRAAIPLNHMMNNLQILGIIVWSSIVRPVRPFIISSHHKRNEKVRESGIRLKLVIIQK